MGRRDSKDLRAVINGVIDDANGGWRVASTVDEDARVLLPQIAKGSKVVIEGDLRFSLRAASRRTSIWAGITGARRTSSEAGDPAEGVTLFHFRDGRWRTLSG